MLQPVLESCSLINEWKIKDNKGAELFQILSDSSEKFNNHDIVITFYLAQDHSAINNQKINIFLKASMNNFYFCNIDMLYHIENIIKKYNENNKNFSFVDVDIENVCKILHLSLSSFSRSTYHSDLDLEKTSTISMIPSSFQDFDSSGIFSIFAIEKINLFFNNYSTSGAKVILENKAISFAFSELKSLIIKDSKNSELALSKIALNSEIVQIKDVEIFGLLEKNIALYDVAHIQKHFESATELNKATISEVFQESSDDSEDLEIFGSNLQTSSYRNLLAKGTEGALRKILVATEDMIFNLKKEKEFNPHFFKIYDHFIQAAALSKASNTAMITQPLILLGELGIGKSYALNRLGSVLQIGSRIINMSLFKISDPIAGASKHWKGAVIGYVAKDLLQSKISSLLFLLDEFDKASSTPNNSDPLSFFYTFLEPENSCRFTDDLLEIPMRADHILWLASVNDLAPILKLILGRCLVVEIHKPDRYQSAVILQSIYKNLNIDCGNIFMETLASDVIEALLDTTPRLAKNILRRAMGKAALVNRFIISTDFLEKPTLESKIGFIGFNR